MKRPYKRIPRYFMDEIDAALDFRNVSIIANYIKDRTKNAQFIIISLRNHMSGSRAGEGSRLRVACPGGGTATISARPRESASHASRRRL